MKFFRLIVLVPTERLARDWLCYLYTLSGPGRAGHSLSAVMLVEYAALLEISTCNNKQQAISSLFICYQPFVSSRNSCAIISHTTSTTSWCRRSIARYTSRHNSHNVRNESRLSNFFQCKPLILYIIHTFPLQFVPRYDEQINVCLHPTTPLLRLVWRGVDVRRFNGRYALPYCVSCYRRALTG